MGNGLNKTPLDELCDNAVNVEILVMRFKDDAARTEVVRDECREKIIEEMRGAKNHARLKYLAIDASRLEKDIASINESIQNMQAVHSWILKSYRMGLQSETIERISSTLKQMTTTKYDPRRTEQMTSDFLKQLESLNKHESVGVTRIDALRKETTDETEAENYLRELKDQLELEKVQSVPDISHMGGVTITRPDEAAAVSEADTEFNRVFMERLQILNSPVSQSSAVT